MVIISENKFVFCQKIRLLVMFRSENEVYHTDPRRKTSDLIYNYSRIVSKNRYIEFKDTTVILNYFVLGLFKLSTEIKQNLQMTMIPLIENPNVVRIWYF